MSVSALGVTILAVSTCFYALALAAVGLRVWASHIRARPWKFYDTLIVASTVFQTGLLISLYYATLSGGLGKHMVEVSDASIVSFFRSFAGQSISWILTTTIVKMSILLFYLDIFRFNRKTRLAIHGFAGFVASYGIASILCVFTICRPFRRMWDQTQEGRCGNIMSAMFATAVINCVEDFVVVVIPLPVIWQLQMSRQKKIGLSAIIGIGFVICGINIARLAVALPIDNTDLTHMLAYQALFINLEVHLGLINACLPTIKSLFKKPQSSITSSTAYSGGSDFAKRSNNSGYTAVSRGPTPEKQPRHMESFVSETELLQSPARTRSF